MFKRKELEKILEIKRKSKKCILNKVSWKDSHSFEGTIEDSRFREDRVFFSFFFNE